ncbi:CdiA family toxin C-terminal domain-containing protein [Terribacillus saccharophilus]|uniref:CdiA family toxin C-terminal domain-containing protein n=1 Tax=Terribacillus saccharophilus TaxID=361277 RepID=UPI003982D184
MDVKYRSSQWDKTKDSLRNLIGLGVWGKGMIDTMKDITDNLDEASEKVAKYDSDGVVSFSYTSDKDKYQRLFEDFKVLEDYSGSVGDIVEDTIDQPFYEDIDAFVQKVRDSSISNYTTSNHIGATETIPISYYGSYQEYETEKTEITIDDILSGDNYYADQIKASFEEWKVQNPDEDISYEDYRTAAVNTRAFEYESIEDGQFTKEFWVNIAALVVIVGVTVVCPPAGAVLGAAYATVEMGSAISGQDWASGRELDTSERWTRGLLAPLDVLPIGNAVTSFGGAARTTSKVIDVGQSASKVNRTNTAVQQADNVIELKIPADRLARTSNVDSAAGQADNVVSLADYANRQTANRLRNSQWAVKEQDKIQELQMAAGAEHLSAGNKMAGNSGPMMMRNDGVGPGGVGPVRGSGESVSSVSKTDSGSLHAGSIRASSETQPIIKYKEGYHVEHLTGEIKKCTDRRGVSGGHNYSEFKKFFETNGKYKLEEIQKFAHPEIDGIYDLEYRMLVEIKDYRGIGTGEYKYIPKENRDPLKKTIYDPAIISDEDIVRYGKEAIEEGIKKGQVDELIDQNKSMVSGTASNGLKFEGIKNLETGEIDNFWPVLEWSER